MTAIQWTDETWNPVTGCSKVSPGCAHCYAETVADRFWAKQYPLVMGIGAKADDGRLYRPRRFTDVMCHEDRLDQPLRWKKPRRIFVNSMSDLFHEDVPDVFIDEVFATMALAPQHRFQILTKRAERMRAYLNRPGKAADVAVSVFKRFTVLAEADVQSRKAVKTWPLPNVWLGVSVENQHFADERIPLLLQTPAALRFISVEPLLGPVDFGQVLEACDECGRRRPNPDCGACLDAPPAIDWVIVGGESGHGARPMDVAWARVIVQQCKAAGVPVFVKQLGAKPRVVGDLTLALGGTGLVPLRDKKGGDPEEWPLDLRVREFPESRP